MGARALVTLSADIGEEYAAQVKAVLYRRLPAGSVVDLALNLPAHRVVEAAFLLRWMAAGFPPGTVHLAIVDPGVGGRRDPIAIECEEGSFLVGPDNGLLDPLARHLGRPRAVRLDPALVGGARPVSATFEGRDLFAPAAVRLAKGTPLDRLGRRFAHRRLELPSPSPLPRGARGVVLHVDRFGNVITNIPGGVLGTPGTRFRFVVGRGPLISARSARTYEEVPPRAMGLVASSYGLVEVSRRASSAARTLKAKAGDPFELRRLDRSARD